VGWQPSRFLTDHDEAEHAFAVAERLGSVNAAAAELGITWPSLRKPSPARPGHAGPQPRGGPVAGERPAAELYEWAVATRSTRCWAPT
jgi:hypothetical protein